MRVITESQYHDWCVERANEAPEPERPPTWMLELAMAGIVTLIWLVAFGAGVDFVKEVLR